MAAAPVVNTPWVERWTVPADHPAFDGHFPGQPVVPGVVLLAQVLELMARHVARPGSLVLRQAKFLSMAGPGATLELSVHPAETSWRFEVREGERLVATGVYATD